MCGIAGIIDFRGLPDHLAGAPMAAALTRLRPRGPDAGGQWQDGQCLLGHRRLAIIDLTEGGAQPMHRHGLVISFNGEIYNHAALRRELAGLGHSFQSQSDTEVLLAGWRQWGPDLLPRLRGMFAFALWDPQAQELVLARDRYGKKPLLYSHDGRRLAFASDLLALHPLTERAGEIDPAALKLLFSLRYIPDPWSILSHVRKLPAGHVARLSADGTLALQRWHRLEAAPERPGSMDEAKAALRHALDAAVLDRLEADVPVGAFLSGGIDSAVVCASLAAQGRKVRSFTVGFAGASDYYEERPAARRVADHLGLDHTEVEISAQDARDCIPAVFGACDEPFADSSALPVFLLSRETRRHVTVALSGDGADEVFGGYRKYLGEVHADRYQTLPAWLRRGLIEPLAARLPEGKDNRLLELSRRARRFLAHAGADPVTRQAGWARLLSEVELAGLMPHCPATPTIEDLVAEHRAHSIDSDPVNRMLAADVGLGLVGDMLTKVDRMSMANSLEVRCPFLDHRVVSLAFSLPGSYKLSDRMGKLVLRQAFADRLPPEVFGLPKKGFEIPIGSWLSGPLRDLVQATTDPGRLRRQGLFNPDLPQRWIADLSAGRRDTSWHLWTLLAFQHWAESNSFMTP